MPVLQGQGQSLHNLTGILTSANMSEKISVVINTYNAAEHLEKVLNHLKGFDEILVCDMESTDGTIEIATRYGCKIVTFPKGDNQICEPARNFAIQSASHKWILVVDADELVPEPLKEYLYERIKDGAFNGALAIARKNMFMGKFSNGTPDYQLRFFQRDRATWPETIHSRPKIDGPVFNAPNKDNLSLLHLDDLSIARRIDKMNVYSDYEVDKRRNKSYNFIKLFTRPLWFFLKQYLIGKGFKDGNRGIVKSYMAAIYQIMLMSKVIERTKQS